jgi:urea transport system permease protein
VFPQGWLFILGLLYILTVLYFDKGFLGLLEKIGARIGIKTNAERYATGSK